MNPIPGRSDFLLARKQTVAQLACDLLPASCVLGRKKGEGIGLPGGDRAAEPSPVMIN
jgi:hypothetical protein